MTDRAANAANATQSSGSPLEQEVIGFFDLLRDPLLRYLLALGLPVADGEEVLQEVFLALFRHLQRGGARTNLRGWLFRVAHNLGLKRRYSTVHPASAAPDSEVVVDPAPDPEQQAIAGQSQRNVQAVVRALPELDRRCLTLRAEGLRYREIAEVLEISLGAVSLCLTRSLARIARVAER